ncbi:MAG: hypothetical protein DRO67_00250 [Candidatus Asgardarchaeum californiense]|nr:MAG: hypothetical protein DRO67_00250 [Candidatus Asgardarchaeum californiense]
MKLLFCSRCFDVFKLDFELRSCKCGKVKGMYTDNTNSVTNGKGISLAIGNGSLINSVLDLNIMPDDLERGDYIESCKIQYAWVRPNEGPGNPHSTVDETLGE